MSHERDELAMVIIHHPWLESHEGLYEGICPECPGRKVNGGYNSPSHADHLADAILAAGYTKPQTTEEFYAENPGDNAPYFYTVTTDREEAEGYLHTDGKLTHRFVTEWEEVK